MMWLLGSLVGLAIGVLVMFLIEEWRYRRWLKS